MVEIFIGGWGNTKSVIRRNRTKPDKVEVETPNILNGDEFRGFWVRWANGNYSAGREGKVNKFIDFLQNLADLSIIFIKKVNIKEHSKFSF